MSRSRLAHAMKCVTPVTMAVSVLVLSGVPASADPADDRIPCTSAGTSYYNLSICATTYVGAHMSAHLDAATIGDPENRRSAVGSMTTPPSSSIAGHTSDRWVAQWDRNWTLGRNRGSVPHPETALQANLRYHLYDYHGQPTPYWAFAYFRTPGMGRNSGDCTIVKETPDGGAEEAPDAPFTCAWDRNSFDPHEWEPSPHLNIETTE